MARYRDIGPAEMTPAQRRVHDLIVAGRRGRFGGPFQLLISAPEICEHAAKLGEHLRWGTSLPDRLSELAIITTAQFSGAPNMNGTLMRRWPRKPVCPLPRSRRSAAASNQTSNKKTRRSSTRSARSYSERAGFQMGRLARRSKLWGKPGWSR